MFSVVELKMDVEVNILFVVVVEKYVSVVTDGDVLFVVGGTPCVVINDFSVVDCDGLRCSPVVDDSVALIEDATPVVVEEGCCSVVVIEDDTAVVVADEIVC